MENTFKTNKYSQYERFLINKKEMEKEKNLPAQQQIITRLQMVFNNKQKMVQMR